jgi:hypothetical protein
MPALGGKIWLLMRKGIFVLERGPGTLRTIACTGAGSGSILAFDGLPDANGELPLAETVGWREIYRANPTVMGSWMLDGGFVNGLTFVHQGGQDGTPSFASIVWVPYKAKKV